MTKFLALVSGFCLTLLIFAGGAFTTLAFVTAEPTEHLAVTTNAAMASADEVVAIEKGQDETEVSTDVGRNAPEQAASPAVQPASGRNAPAEPPVDPMTTAALANDTASPVPVEEQGSQLGAEHIAWCSQHYRSYDRADNHYNSYSGERRQCVSPFSEAEAPAEESGSIIQASNDGNSGVIGAAQADEMPSGAMDWQHVQDCFARYRSYRPEDNSYQPYGGGPRQQCE